MSDLYIESRLQAIKDIASTSCSDIKDADNIAGFCDEIYSAIPKLDKIIEELESEKRYGSKYDSYYEENLYRGEMFENDVNNKTIDKAIEIVKQGGVSNYPKGE